MSTVATDTRTTGPSGRRGGRGGGSGPNSGSRGGMGGGRRKNNTNASRSTAARAVAEGSTTAQPVAAKEDQIPVEDKTAALTLADTPAAAAADDDEAVADGEVCWLCAEPIKFSSVAECNHRTCHVCAVRLRALYKKMECTFCKTPQPKVIFTESRSRPWEDYTLDMIPFTDDKLKISFETNDMMQETLFLLRFNCPDTECTFTGTGWADLKWHVRDMHGLVLCDLCIRHKKIFAHEHSLYTPKLLLQHLPNLKRAPTMPPQHQHRSKDPDKGKDTGGGKEMTEVDFVHPMCSFCRECFYGDDELYAHLRERHEECFVCKRLGLRDVYFQNYEKLDEHFQSDHYPCKHGSCLEQKFVVFSSAMDLQAHQLQAHGQTMGARERKDKKRIDAGFTFDDVRSGRGRGGGNLVTNVASGSQSNPGGSRRAAFGGHLTTRDEQVSPQQQDEHADVILQTSDLAPLQEHLKNLSTAAQFHVISSVRSYRASECPAREMLDTIFGIFDRNLDVMGSVVTKILDVFESNEEKKTQLLGAWNAIKIEERNQFPSLAPVASSSQAGWAGIASGRVINIKKTTSQRPSRSNNHQTARRVWDRVEQAATSSGPPPSLLTPSNRAAQPRPKASGSNLSGSAFPSLSASASVPGSAQNVRAATAAASQRTTPWTSSSSSTPAPAPPAPTSIPVMQPFSVSVPTNSTRASGAPTTSSMAQFPSLQASSSARTPPPREFLTGNKSIRNIQGNAPGPARSAWASDSANPPVSLPSSSDTNGSAAASKKKKKGKEKLFTLGAHAGPA